MPENVAISSHGMEVAESPDTIITGKAKFYGVLIETDLSNGVTVTISDGATEKITFIVPGSDGSGGFMLPKPIAITTSLIVTLSGTASRAVFFWSR